jgi:hypothetical protein
MAYQTSGLIGVNLANEDDTAKFKLGTIVHGDNGSEWIYVECSGAVSQYHWVAIDENFLAVVGTTALAEVKHRFGLAQIAFTSAGYGWVAIRGTHTATFDGTASADIDLFTSSTSGQLSDVTGGAEISGITLVTAVSTQNQTATVIMSYPQVLVRSASS